MERYWEFVSRPPLEHSMVTGYAGTDDFMVKFLAATALFSWIYANSITTAKMYWPNWYSRLSERNRKVYPSYVISTMHHMVMVPIAWVHILRDFRRTEEELRVVDYAKAHVWVAPISMGYTLADTICYAIPEAFNGRYEFLLHHVMLLAFVAGCLSLPGHIMRYLPHFTVSETANILFNAAWFMRHSNWRNGKLQLLMELGFAAGFVVLRNINMTLIILFMCYHERSSLGWWSALILPVGIMQFYWLYLIVHSTFRKLFKRE